MTDVNVTVALNWHTAQFWDRVTCHMLKLEPPNTDVHQALIATHHALADAILDKTCINCGTRPTRRRTSSRMCDACHTYTQKYGEPPNHTVLDKRDGDAS